MSDFVITPYTNYVVVQCGRGLASVVRKVLEGIYSEEVIFKVENPSYNTHYFLFAATASAENIARLLRMYRPGVFVTEVREPCNWSFL